MNSELIIVPPNPLWLLRTKWPRAEISGVTGVGVRTIQRHDLKYNPKPYIHRKYLQACKEMFSLTPAPTNDLDKVYYDATKKLLSIWGTQRWVEKNL
jgi:hypothetical protein